MSDGTPLIYGNHRAYYLKRGLLSATSAREDVDPRLAKLFQFLEGEKVSRDDFRYILDIGCNSGKTTVDLAQHLKSALSITGVDLDAELIRQAKNALRFAWSRKQPRADTAEGGNYFPACFPSLLGSLAWPEVPKGEPAPFPNNVHFIVADVTKRVNGRLAWEPESKYDLVVAMSVTKWIHIHNGDEGLLSFFDFLRDRVKDGGLLLLEPHEEGSYTRSTKGLPKAVVEAAKRLTIRPSDHESLLLSRGFSLAKELQVASAEHPRPLLLYQKGKTNVS